MSECTNSLPASPTSGVRPGQTVAVMDWDTHRYLECFFAIPMMGAVLHTVNVRLSPEQILYTIDRRKTTSFLSTPSFCRSWNRCGRRVEPGKKLVLLNDAPTPRDPTRLRGGIEALLAKSDPDCTFPELDETTQATTFYTTGTTGLPQGESVSAIGSLSCTRSRHGRRWPEPATAVSIRAMYYASDADVSCSRLGPSLCRDDARGEADLPGPIPSRCPAQFRPPREGYLFALRADDLADILASAKKQAIDLTGWKGLVMVARRCPSACSPGAGGWRGPVHRLWHVRNRPILTLSHLKPHMEEWDTDRQAEARCKTGRTVPVCTASHRRRSNE